MWLLIERDWERTFFTSNLFFPSLPSSFPLDGAEVVGGSTSMSAIVVSVQEQAVDSLERASGVIVHSGNMWLPLIRLVQTLISRTYRSLSRSLVCLNT